MPHEWSGARLSEWNAYGKIKLWKQKAANEFMSCMRSALRSVHWMQSVCCKYRTIHLILAAAPTYALGSYSEFFSIPQLIKEQHLTFSTQHMYFQFNLRKMSNLPQISKTWRQKNKIRLAGHLSGQRGYLHEITPSRPLSFLLPLLLCVRSWYMPRIKGGGSLPLLFCMGRE